MKYNYAKTEMEIDKGYETYQIIKDFDNPIQIFREAFQNSIDEYATEIYCRISVEHLLGIENLIVDIWDNGSGLQETGIPCFFGLAKSTKLTPEKTPAGKLGYKGHGTKIYFNSEKIEVVSKPEKNKPGWGIVLEDPIGQIRKSGTYFYSEKIDAEDCSAKLPNDFTTGLLVRIKNPYHFKSQHTRFMLNHMYLRDYSKWFTVFGNIRRLFNADMPNATLYLHGLNIDQFRDCYKEPNQIQPIPEIISKDSELYEKIEMGHYFPPNRSDDASMKKYATKIGSNKPYYDYYSRRIYENKVHLNNNVSFNFIVHTEGYETKRMYDILLSRREKNQVDKNLQHLDSERYGLWACKGGVPIERIDDWIAGGRGIGTYTYLHAFIDCDAFELTANRGSIRNTDLEILDQIRGKINEILSDTKIQDRLKERETWEETERIRRTIQEDAKELKSRFSLCQNKKSIKLPTNIKIPEPTSLKSGYSESETLMLLIRILDYYPDLFTFNILDYNTTKGIDFVVEKGANPKYIELKGTFRKKVNHSFRNVHKFICYDIDMMNNDIVEDVEQLPAKLRVNSDDQFESFITKYNGKKYTSYQLIPETAKIESMEVIVLKQLLPEVLGVKLE